MRRTIGVQTPTDKLKRGITVISKQQSELRIFALINRVRDKDKYIMNNFFEEASPETCGIPSEYLINYVNRLEREDYYMHSLLVFKANKLCMETYYNPYDRDMLHRMFSITKAFTSIAIGFLIDDGKVSLSDRIVTHFPEKLPAAGAHPYLEQLTIEQMLSMRTCHNKTTYRMVGMTDWVGSFFTTKPTHMPGTNFAYDTSAAHVLCALVEKLTGMPMLDYLREKFLNKIGFSRDAYILTDPSGVSMGGTGLCATPYDVAKVLYIVAHNGEWNGEQLIPRDYIVSAITKHSDTYGRMQSTEEMQGYGYMFWCTRDNGFVMYGMGGQLAWYLPDMDIMMVTCGDVQARHGGVQAIYNAFREEVYNKLVVADTTCNIDNNSIENNATLRLKKSILSVPGSATSKNLANINEVKFNLNSNSQGFSNISLSIDSAHSCGVLYYTLDNVAYSLKFGIGYNEVQTFPGYNFKCAASGAFRMDETFLIIAHIIDSSIGRVYFILNYTPDCKNITLFIRKAEESFFTEYDVVVSGASAEFS